MEKSRREVCYARAGDFWEKSHQVQLALRSELKNLQREIFFSPHVSRARVSRGKWRGLCLVHAARDGLKHM